MLFKGLSKSTFIKTIQDAVSQFWVDLRTITHFLKKKKMGLHEVVSLVQLKPRNKQYICQEIFYFNNFWIPCYYYIHFIKHFEIIFLNHWIPGHWFPSCLFQNMLLKYEIHTEKCICHVYCWTKCHKQDLPVWPSAQDGKQNILIISEPLTCSLLILISWCPTAEISSAWLCTRDFFHM